MSLKSQRLRRNQQTGNSDRLEVRPVSEQRDHRSFVLYGRSATGKTTLASTWPKPILFLDVKDEGTDSISDVKQVDVRDVKSFEDFELTYEWIIRHPEDYATIVIDTISQLQQMVVSEIGGKSKMKGDRAAGDWGSMSKRDWGDVAALMKEWILNYRDLSHLGINIVFIAQDRTFNIDDGESEGDEQLSPEVGPALSPSIVKVLNASVSMIGNTFIRVKDTKKEVRGKTRERKEYQYCLRVGPNPTYVTKVRKPRSATPLGVLVDARYEDILAIIKGE